MVTEGADRTRRRRRNLAILIVVVLALLLLAIVPWLFDGKAEPKAEIGTPTQWALVVPSLSIDAPLRAIDTTRGGVLDPPANPRDVGWWSQSARPGASYGQTIVTGHTVHTGGGQMDHLGRMKIGAEIEITDKGSITYYRATKVFTLTKGQVDQQAAELFGQTSPTNRLVLITCSGWTGHGYTSNVFVYATPTRTALTPVGS